MHIQEALSLLRIADLSDVRDANEAIRRFRLVVTHDNVDDCSTALHAVITAIVARDVYGEKKDINSAPNKKKRAAEAIDSSAPNKKKRAAKAIDSSAPNKKKTAAGGGVNDLVVLLMRNGKVSFDGRTYDYNDRKHASSSSSCGRFVTYLFEGQKCGVHDHLIWQSQNVYLMEKVRPCEHRTLIGKVVACSVERQGDRQNSVPALYKLTVHKVDNSSPWMFEDCQWVQIDDGVKYRHVTNDLMRCFGVSRGDLAGNIRLSGIQIIKGVPTMTLPPLIA